MTTSTFRVERTTLVRYPKLTATVPKELVHRASVAEVMLTDWRRTDEARFSLTAQWPRGHSFFTPDEDGNHDPLIAAETIRQAGTLLAHAEFGVPLGHPFLVHDLDIAVHPEHLRVGHAPAALELDLACTGVRRRAGRLTGLSVRVVISRQGDVVATGGGSFSCLQPAVYQRIRGARPLDDTGQLPLVAPAAPQSVGRMSPRDVVLSPLGEADRWQLRVDTRHPVLFDHPVDHVPGMLLMEAARQATAGLLGRSSLLPLRIGVEFKQYVELDRPCTVSARRAPRQAHPGTETVLVTAHQSGRPVFDAAVRATASDR
jgi:hypothetical protein